MIFYDIIYKNKSAQSLGVYVKERPSFPVPERDKTFTTIPGRSGSLVTDDGTYSDVTISIKFNFVDEDENAIGKVFRAAKAWLLSAGSGRMVVSDDTNVFHIVKDVTITDSDRTAKIGHAFTAKFRLDPYTYLTSGDSEISLPAALYNQYEPCEPVYKIEGEGVCTITTSAGTVTANIGQNLTIDCANRMSYRTDTGVRNNIALTGDMEDLMIPTGLFNISLSSGFTGTVTPHWRAV